MRICIFFNISLISFKIFFISMKMVTVLINARKWSNIIILTVNVTTISCLTLQEFVCRFVNYMFYTKIPLNVHVRKAFHLVSMVNVYPHVIRSNN